MPKYDLDNGEIVLHIRDSKTGENFTIRVNLNNAIVEDGIKVEVE